MSKELETALDAVSQLGQAETDAPGSQREYLERNTRTSTDGGEVSGIVVSLRGVLTEAETSVYWYNKLCADAADTIQSQQAEIERLKSENTELSEQLAANEEDGCSADEEIMKLQARVKDLEGALRGLLDLIEHPSHDHDDTLPEIIEANKVLDKFRKALSPKTGES